MSLGPSNVALVFDMISSATGFGGLSGTATGNGASVKLPPGKKGIQVSIPTSATLTVKVQNSIDNVNWFDVSSSTVSTVGVTGGSFLSEVDSVVPYWRAAITAFTTGGTGATQTPPVVKICQVMPPGATSSV